MKYTIMLIGLIGAWSFTANGEPVHFESDSSVFYLNHISELRVHISGPAAKMMYEKGEKARGSRIINDFGYKATDYGPLTCTKSPKSGMFGSVTFEYDCGLAIPDSAL